MGIIRRFHCTLWLLSAGISASGQATLHTIDVKAVAEIETKMRQDGREVTVLAPADRVVPGDAVVYTLEIRNTGTDDVVGPSIVRPVPEHMTYVADSATGPGAVISYSVDGGVTFDRPEKLRVADALHRTRRADAGEYTHIRWDLRITLKSKSVAYARFRAVVK